MAPPSDPSPLSRRRFLAGTAVLTMATLAGCGDDDDDAEADTGDTTANTTTTSSSEGAAKPLTFVDARGETITFDAPPERVVAWEAIVPALVELGVTPVGVLAFQDLATNPSFQDAQVDTGGLTAVSTAYGEVDLEALAKLEPDLIVTYTFGEDLLTGFTDPNTQQLAEQIAPLVVIDGLAEVSAGIDHVEELAALLGADLDSAANRQAATEFDEATEELRAVVAAKPGLTVAFGGVTPIGLFLAPIESYPELRYYQELGLDVLDGPADQVLSWELVSDVDADVLLLDDRTTEAELAEADGIEIWKTIPAVAADQADIGWRFLVTYCRADYTRSMRRILPSLQDADASVI